METRSEQTFALGPRVAGMLSAAPTGPWASRALMFMAVAVLFTTFVRTVYTAPVVDFEAYYTGAVDLRDGVRLYGPALAWRESEYSVHHPTKPMPTDKMPYVYPPGLAVAFLPLTLLPIAAARIVWVGLLFACLIGAAYISIATLLRVSPRRRVLGTLGLGALYV